jgi:hypothetical protein
MKYIKLFDSFKHVPHDHEDIEYTYNPNNIKIGYHISPSKNDASIFKNGIKPTRGDNAYIWADENFANWFSETYYGDIHDRNEDWFQTSTKWILNVEGLELERDPESEDMGGWGPFPSGLFGHAYIYKGVIPPDRIISKVSTK